MNRALRVRVLLLSEERHDIAKGFFKRAKARFGRERIPKDSFYRFCRTEALDKRPTESASVHQMPAMTFER
eukprot:1029453-Amphidinium_carterae.1